MYQKGTRKGTVKFGIKPTVSAQQVLLAGDFNTWQPMEMKKLKDGRFVAEVPATKAAMEYKFVVDGMWITDPDHSHWARNPYGTMNSVANLAGGC